MAIITYIGPYQPQYRSDVGAYMAGQHNPNMPTPAEFNCIRQFLSDLRTAAQNVVGYRSADGTTEVVNLSQCGHVVEFWNNGTLVAVIRRGTYP